LLPVIGLINHPPKDFRKIFREDVHYYCIVNVLRMFMAAKNPPKRARAIKQKFASQANFGAK